MNKTQSHPSHELMYMCVRTLISKHYMRLNALVSCRNRLLRSSFYLGSIMHAVTWYYVQSRGRAFLVTPGVCRSDMKRVSRWLSVFITCMYKILMWAYCHALLTCLRSVRYPFCCVEAGVKNSFELSACTQGCRDNNVFLLLTMAVVGRVRDALVS